MKQTKIIKQRNFVQEYSLLINHSAVFKDRKRAFKNGEMKHKKNIFERSWNIPQPQLSVVIKNLLRTYQNF